MSGESFAARLARLRREPAPESRVEQRHGLPDALRAQLARRPARVLAQRDPRSTTGDPVRLAGDAEAAFAVRHEVQPAEYVHGCVRLGDALRAGADVVARIACDPELGAFRAERALYLDIETTGLSGGAGTYPFLVGVGAFEGEVFRVRQFFLRHPGGERALLAEVAELVAAGECVVTFFGKSFDRHRLEDKMRLHGVPTPFPGKPHLDLYHPFRRLYRGSLPDGKLQTCERGLLGLEREDDLSGAYAPAAWFDHQAGRPHLLEQVFRHNLLDVWSLVALVAHLGDTERERDARGEALRGCALTRARGWARLAARERDRERERRWLDRAAERLPSDLAEHAAERRELDLARADSLRLDGLRDRALERYLDLARGGDGIAARAGHEAGRILVRRRADRERGRQVLEAARRDALHGLSGPERRGLLERIDAALIRASADLG